MSTVAARRPLKRAWLSVLFIPIGLAVAFLLGESIPGLTGNGWTHTTDLPPGLAFALSVIAVLLIGLPSTSAIAYGAIAASTGDRRGVLPLIIGAAALAYLAVTTIGAVIGVA